MSQPSRRKGGLGRGLASLIPTGPAEGGEDPTPHGPRLGAAAADVMFGGPTPPGAPTDIGAAQPKGVVLVMHLVKGHIAVLNSRIQPNGDADHPEGQCALPYHLHHTDRKSVV